MWTERDTNALKVFLVIVVSVVVIWVVGSYITQQQQDTSDQIERSLGS